MIKKKISSKGFTLVEVLVCIVVAAVIIGTLSQVVTNYVHLSKKGRYMNIANSYVEAKVESLRNSGYNSISIGTTNLKSELSTQLPPSRDASMTISTPQAGIKQVSINVSYKEGGQTISNDYTTYIGELGVGQ